MIWKNPFLSKNSEQQILESEYLSLFDCTVLQMIDRENLSTISFVSSTPGAGKTSLFRAFSSRIMSTAMAEESMNQYREYRLQMERLGVIRNGSISLATAILSCARNYSIIDEMFQNGRRRQVFFALLNYRIAITLMRSMGQVLNLEIREYSRITFYELPSEMMSEADDFENGLTVYNWACKGERLLCQYLDSEREEALDISFVHTTLLLIKLFEPDNILFDGKPHFTSTLLIFDDFHKLSDCQRGAVSEAAYQLKTSSGIWFGQRLEGLENLQIISMDGSLSREYNHNIVIDNYWPEKSQAFYKMLGNIADRRVKEAAIDSFTNFSDCVTDKLEGKKYQKELTRYIDTVKGRIAENHKSRYCYRNVISFLDGVTMDIAEKAIWYECILIKENRKNIGQLSLFLGEQEKLEDFREFVEQNRKGAWYYICYKCKLPYYIGINNLKIISSYNVEQFLVFAGAYFDYCRVKLLGKSPRGKKYRLSAEEQRSALQKTVSQLWEDMNFRYSNIGVIKCFLDNIGTLGERSRDAERNSYEGGAYTGIGLNSIELKDGLRNPKYAQLVEILGACLASRYLERKEINMGKTVVFYLNRWLCVHYNLPICYGGWKRCSLDTVWKMCRSDRINQMEEQMSLEF